MNFLLIFSIVCITSVHDYIILVGDKLQISVYGSVSFSYQQTVTPSGEIYIQYVSIPPSEEAPFFAWEVLDVMNIKGMTITKATSIVEERFNKYFKNVKVNLSVIAFRDKVFLTGAVTKPGSYPFIPGLTVSEYIECAGGIQPYGDLSKITIKKYDSTIDASSGSMVEQNWNIYIPKAYVYVKGMVTIPGAHHFNPDLNGLDYIGLSGGPTDRANIKKAYIITTNGERLPIENNPPMYSTIVIPEVSLKWWQDHLTIVSIITTVLVTLLTITK
ncbi:SLBB domain-containing protein [candidate division WOR-3 bacterium]|nr:SLBB domain-containing protein [candidate division WOR-3 bacterium]